MRDQESGGWWPGALRAAEVSCSEAISACGQEHDSMMLT